MDKLEIIDKIIDAYRFEVSPPNTSLPLSNVLKHLKIEFSDNENGRKEFDDIYKALCFTKLFDVKPNTNKDGYNPYFRLKEESEKELYKFPKYSDYENSMQEAKLLKEKREEDIHKASIETPKIAKNSIKLSALALIISVVLTLYQIIKDNSKEDETKLFNSRLNRIDSLVKTQSHVKKDTILRKTNLKK